MNFTFYEPHVVIEITTFHDKVTDYILERQTVCINSQLDTHHYTALLWCHIYDVTINLANHLMDK